MDIKPEFFKSLHTFFSNENHDFSFYVSKLLKRESICLANSPKKIKNLFDQE